MFGTSGIRGIVNEDITAELALKVGKACGRIYKKIIVGNDPRTSSLMIKNALIAGLLSDGSNVFDAGLTATPTLAYSAKHYDAGIMITASHNPSQYNGIKIFNKDGSGISLKESKKIEEEMKKERKGVNWKEIGNYERKDVIEEYIDEIIRNVKIKRKEKIIIDCSNGSASTITPYLLRKIGLNVITLNAQPDGFFPAHPPEPIEENLLQLKELCKKEKSFGIAHDCDADRMVAIDKNGNYIENDKLIVLFSKYLNAKKIVVPIDTSMLIDKFIDAKIIKTRVGDIFVSEKLKEINGDFGAEASGTWTFPSLSFCPDGIYASAKFVEMFQEIDVMEEIKRLPNYPIKRGGIIVKNKKKIMEKIREEINSFNPLNLIDIDGYRLDFDDSWILIRPSGTEPKIRITVEAEKKERMKKLWEDSIKLVKRCEK